MPPFVWLCQFSYTISFTMDLEQLLKPHLTSNKIRSIYIQFFPHHYQLILVQASSFPHSTKHMEDIMQMTTLFANIHDR